MVTGYSSYWMETIDYSINCIFCLEIRSQNFHKIFLFSRLDARWCMASRISLTFSTPGFIPSRVTCNVFACMLNSNYSFDLWLCFTPFFILRTQISYDILFYMYIWWIAENTTINQCFKQNLYVHSTMYNCNITWKTTYPTYRSCSA